MNSVAGTKRKLTDVPIDAAATKKAKLSPPQEVDSETEPEESAGERWLQCSLRSKNDSLCEEVVPIPAEGIAKFA